MIIKLRFLMVVVVFAGLAANAQAIKDSIVFKNGDVMVGEIKSMDRGVLIVETDYSDSDFHIEWDGIREIYSGNFFLISMSDGYRYNGSFESLDSTTLIIKDLNGPVQTRIMEIVYIKSLDKDFWSRLNASIDVGLSLTKANNLRQFDSRASFGYLAEKWSADASVSSLISAQTDVEATKRTDANGTFTWFLKKAWFIPATLGALSNTEQKLDLRMSGKLGLGKYAIRTNASYLGFSLGGSYNNEKYSNEAEIRKSWEAYLGSELNLYNIGDLKLLVTVVIFQGLTDIERFRSDLKFDLKYDLPLDFYIKLGATLNYDNKPAAGASETDYVLQTGLGWEL